MIDKTLEKIAEFDKFGSILGLERMKKLMDELGNPQDELKYIHVAGTNGKGSVCRYIYSALLSNGYSVGLFTSPFLEVFNERIEMNGELINDEDLESCTNEVVEKVEKMVANGLDSPTEFEVVTAIAFVYFSRKKADFVVLEVGLGGTGDSTNIIRAPEISIITSISYDHMDRLGDTLAAIAGEKAGIIKKGVPVVMNVKDREAQVPIAKKAYEKDSVLYDVSKIPYAIVYKSYNCYEVDANIYGTDYSGVKISMVGKHQVDNVITALVALEILRKAGKIKVERSKLYDGIFKARHKGRFERIGDKILLDGAHNEDGARALVETIKELYKDKKILMLTSMLKDKEYEKMFKLFTEISSDFIVTEIDNPRKCAADELAKAIRRNLLEKGSKSEDEVSSSAYVVPDMKEALEISLARLEKFDVLLIAGSLYLAGAVRDICLQFQNIK